MTDNVILKMSASRELDIWVAEKVMGGMPWGPFQPSTDISAAWEVVEKMREQDYGFVIGNDDQDIVVQFIAPYNIGFYRDDKDLRAEAKTAPEAICKAALLAVMKESEQK